MKILGMGGLEFVIILVIILIIFGPKNLPKLGNALGKTVSNLRAGLSEGKKKDKDGAGEAAADEEAAAEEATVAAAELEGEVAEVQAEAAAEDAPAEPAEPAEAFDPEAAVDEVFEQKKVRRVVKKKVAADSADKQ